jgi:tRNA pseudouridine55 synthase
MTTPEHPHDLRISEDEILLVDKPKGWTSFDVVNKIRVLFHVRKVGHAGTLDPMATGLLIVCMGRKTKEVEQYAGLEKEYWTRIMLGGRTESFDAETPVFERRSTEDVTEEKVRIVLRQFTGYQTQIPPMWSAAKVGGKRLYKYARRGEKVERRPREILVHAIVAELIAVPDVRFTVVCSKGTYVRALVEDIGLRLGCGGYMCDLRRTRIGPYHVRDAVTVQDLIDYRSTVSSRSV